MEQFTSIFEYLPAQRIAVCKSHQQGVIKSQLKTHLDTKHQEYVRRTRREIVEVVQAEASLQQWAMTQDEVVYPSPESSPLPHLPVYRDGLRCQQCPYVNRSIKRIQEHCRQEHGWKGDSRLKPGRPSGTRSMWTSVSCQKFQNTSKMGRLFEVSAATEAQHTGDADVDISRAIEESLTQATAQLEELEEKKNSTIQANDDRYDFSKWLDRAGWARHLKGLKRDWLLTMATKPTTKERALYEVCWAARMVMWRAQQASKASVVGLPAMMYINRREFGGKGNEKPFNAQQTGKTMVKYSNWWLEVISYIWRTHELPVVSSRNDDVEVEGKRPPYQINGRQDMWLQKIKMIVGRDQEEDWFEEMESDGEGDEERLDEAQEEELEGHVLQFMLALLDHFLGDSEYTSALISGMAVLGISAEDGWLSPLVYTPKQAAIVNTSRMLVLYRSTQLRQQEVGKLMAEGWGAEDAKAMAPSHFHLVQEMAQRFMTLTDYNGKPTPIDYIQRLKAFGFHIRYNTNAEGVVDWNGDTLLYRNIRFSMPQMRSMIHGTMASTRQQIVRDLMLLQIDDEGAIAKDTTALPVIDWARLVDNAAEQRVGWSFMEDPRNKNATSVDDPKQWLAQRVQKEKAIQNSFIDVEVTRAALPRGGSVVWLRDRIRAYGQAMKEARHKLAALVHMTGGAPARATELVTVKYKNSANGDSRGIFIEDGLVVFVTKYHKNIGQSGNGKVIHRYLPREVGELVVYYLWFASPFWHQIEGAVRGKAVDTSAYMWEPQPEQVWQKPERKRRRGAKSVQSRSKSAKRDSRCRSVGRASQDSWEEGAESGDDTEQQDDQQRPIELWNTNRVKHAMQKASLPHMGVKLNVQAWRHGTKAMYRRYIHNRAAVKAFLDADEDSDGSENDDEFFDIQTGHGSRMAGGIYGRPVTEAMFSVEAKRIGLRLASMEWHAFLQIPSTMSMKPRKGTQAAAARKEAVEEEYRRWKMMRLVDVDAELKNLLGDQAEFRSVQRPAIQAIMQHKSPVVAIMGTGAGKSVLFMLPASVSSGVTIVIVPLVALRFDMKERCEQLGIVSAEWNSRRPHESAQVMFVTPEAAVGEMFGDYITRQRLMGRLDRIVVDECHAVLDSLDGFRSRMLKLRSLVRAETQMVYLTATLRPSEEQQFIDVMGLPSKRQCQWFRGQTTRKNIRYRVHAYDTADEQQAVQDLVEDLKNKYPLPGQVVVYCGLVKRTKDMAKKLGAVCYHREVGSIEEKKEIVKQLTSGQQQVFTATNALGLGIDAPTIRAVVHIGTIRKMRHYAQESGRAGRDGKPSEAIIMRGYRNTRQGRVYGKFGKDVEAEMQDLIAGEGCMRKVIDQAMDGVDGVDGVDTRWECEEDEERCQRCARPGVGRAQEEEWVTAEKMEFEQQGRGRKWLAEQEMERQCREAAEVEALVELMEEWRVGCQLCRAWGEDGRGHELEDCVHEQAENAREGCERFQKDWIYVKFSCCYDCKLPQALCRSFEMDIMDGGYRKKAGRRCQYEGVLMKTLVVALMREVFKVPEFFHGAIKEDGVAGGLGFEEDEEDEKDEKDEEDEDVGGTFRAMVQWGSGRKRWGGIEGNKLSWIIGRIVGCLKG